MSSKRTDKIDMETLERNLNANKESRKFFYPREYILNFLIFMTCEYCGKHFFTSKISLFGTIWSAFVRDAADGTR